MKTKASTTAPAGARKVAAGSMRRVRTQAPGEPKTTMVHVRLDDRLKSDATSVLDEIGISLSEALRVFLRRVVREKALPFRLEVPNAPTRAAMRETRQAKALPRFNSADELFDELEKGRVR